MPRAEEFVREQQVEIVDTNYFITAENKERLEQAKSANSIQFDQRLPESENAVRKAHNLLPTVKIHANGIVAADNVLHNAVLSEKELPSLESCIENGEKMPCRKEMLAEWSTYQYI